MKETIKRLEKYIEDDKLLRDNNELSDFDKFCIEHCNDIKKVITAYKTQRNKIENTINDLYNELAQYQTSIFPQDMETTMRIAREEDKLKAQIEILEKIKEEEK